MIYRTVYFDPDAQKIRWSSCAMKSQKYNYKNIGIASRIEFDFLIELLYDRYENKDIPLEDLKDIFLKFREFCDSVKLG